MSCFSEPIFVPRVQAAWGAGVALLLLAAPAAAQQDLDHRVSAAIHRGRAALLPRLAEELQAPAGDQPMGRIAFLLAACLEAHVPASHDVVRDAIDKLASLEPEGTYSVACHVLALDAYWQARHREQGAGLPQDREAAAPGAGRVRRAPPAGDAVRRRMASLVEWLLRGQGGTWDHSGRGGADLADTQLAILALDAAMQNDITVPGDVFRAIAERLVGSFRPDGAAVSLEVVYKTPAWEGVTPGRTRATVIKTEPGGWNHKLQPQESPSPKMTAAGVASLIIARRALVAAGQYEAPLSADVDRRIESGLAWMSSAFPRYLGGDLSGLHSLEIVGDLGSIQAVGKIDWYVEGARCLLRSQDRQGSWGTEVDTALALLFLTRATRSHAQRLGPRILPAAAGVSGHGVEAGELVYLAPLRGFVRAVELFGFLAETRDPAVLPLVDAAVKAIAQHRAEETFHHLLPLWTGEADEVTAYARRTLAEIAGVGSGGRDAFERLAAALRRMSELERKGADAGGEAAQLLQSSDSTLLVRRALEFADRREILEAFPAVISKLTAGDTLVARRAGEVLARWAGESGPRVSPGDPAATVERTWRDWWQRQGAALVASRRAGMLIAELEHAADTFAQDAAARSLSRLGPDAVPHILGAMSQGSYSLHLVRVLEMITGKAAGIRLEDWRRAVAAGK